MPKILKTVSVLVFLCIAIYSQAGDQDVAQSLVKSGQLEEAYRVLQKTLDKETDGSKKAILQFELGVIASRLNWQEKSQIALQESLKLGIELEDHANLLLGKSLMSAGKFDEAKQCFLKVETYKPRVTPLYYDTEFALGEIAMKQEQWRVAEGHFAYLERHLRHDERYPGILWDLLRVQIARQKKWIACKWATKLYSKFPAHSLVKEWGVDLQKAVVDGKPLGCVASLDNQTTRVRNLQVQGLFEEAQKEIEQIKSRSTELTKSHSDFLTATYLSSEGKVQDALNLLLPHYKKENVNFNFLMLLAKTAAQVGEFQMAVGAYHRAYTLKKNTKQGRTALFQAAFLSYQFQDYDGAGRKFEELIRNYPRSGLSRDAEWHLAWIHYLKANYQGAYDGFKKLVVRKKSRRQFVTDDKAVYWMAMSLLKMNRVPEAESIFAQQAQDRLLGYYSIASQARLVQLKKTVPARTMAAADGKPTDVLASVSEATQAASVSEENESEDNEATLADSDDSDDQDQAEATETSPGGVDLELPSFKKPNLVRHLKRAEVLASLGFTQWSTWELAEIERQTSQPSSLKTLISHYETVEAYNRSSYIAQVYFNKQRARGFQGDAKTLWQEAFPRAYDRSVTTFAKAFSVPEEFVWGIMRAESHYKMDVKSPAGAMGLMQLMPFTGRKIASILEISTFQTDQLLDPAFNIRLGSRYLQRLLKIFDQKVPLAAAGYNAGPHRVRSWLQTFGKLDMDEFVEHIPFLETRNYVKKVVQNYQTYRLLYGKPKEEPLAWLAQPVGVNVEGKVEAREDWSAL